MKSVVRFIGMAIAIVMLAGVSRASAQIAGDEVEFTTTFPFVVGNTMVPAGTYTIKEAGDEPSVLRLSGANASALFVTQPTLPQEAPTRTEVVFVRYGHDYVLKDIYSERSDTGAETVPSEGEPVVSNATAATGEQHVAARRKTATGQ